MLAKKKKLTKAEQVQLAELISRAAVNSQPINLGDYELAVKAEEKSAVETTLAERGSRYGDFTDHAQIAQDLQDVMRGVLTTKEAPEGGTYSFNY